VRKKKMRQLVVLHQMTEYPKFSTTTARFDESTFDGRLQQILTIFDPRKLLVSSADLDKSMALVAEYERLGKAPLGATDEQLWEAKEIKQARCHPDDGAKILLPFCFAAYVPMQPPIVLGFLWPGGGVMNQVFWQWYNQSYNAMVWYHNKNKSSDVTNMDMFKSYVAACFAGEPVLPVYVCWVNLFLLLSTLESIYQVLGCQLVLRSLEMH
jgi:hypothetical protein